MKKNKNMPTPSLNIAILIDGDNASSNKLQEIIEFASRYGQPIVKRIYGDWSKPAMSGWKEPAKEYSFRLIEAQAYVKGKNTTDFALIIDAMDLLNSGSIGGFCLVSSDSDYTLLAQRIREEGLLVLGYGKTKAPIAFVNSCKKFEFSDKIPPVKTGNGKGDTPNIILEKEKDIFDKAFEMAASGKDEVTLSQIGMALKVINPKFKIKRYGVKKLGDIYKLLDEYELIQTGEKGIYNTVRKKDSSGKV